MLQLIKISTIESLNKYCANGQPFSMETTRWRSPGF